MNITITITNPTVNVLAALAGAHAADNAKMMDSLDKASTALDVLLDEIARTKAQPEQAPNDAPQQPTQPDPQDTALRVGGETARHWMGIAQCFAGPPENPPAPGTRRPAR